MLGDGAPAIKNFLHPVGEAPTGAGEGPWLPKLRTPLPVSLNPNRSAAMCQGEEAHFGGIVACAGLFSLR